MASSQTGGDTALYAPLVKACIGDLPLHSIWFVEVPRKIAIVLDEKVDRYLFESLKVNPQDLLHFDRMGDHVKGVYITIKGSNGNGFIDDNGEPYDFASRCFAPWLGIDEDPVTGSMHCALASLWSNLLGKKKFYARQCSARGGVIHAELRDDGRVYLRGNAVTVINGRIAI